MQGATTKRRHILHDVAAGLGPRTGAAAGAQLPFDHIFDTFDPWHVPNT
jgi:hypothetical protein